MKSSTSSQQRCCVSMETSFCCTLQVTGGAEPWAAVTELCCSPFLVPLEQQEADRPRCSERCRQGPHGPHASLSGAIRRRVRSLNRKRFLKAIDRSGVEAGSY